MAAVSEERLVARPQGQGQSKSTKGADSSLGPLPLVLGVTGHRDIPDDDKSRLSAIVDEALGQLRSSYPHTPLVLLSPLAEGADRLVAKAALAHGDRLIVPLPMDRELYIEDFSSQQSRDEFGQLLDEAEYVFELMPLADDEEIKGVGNARNRQYEQVGAYIARHSQILIALWDGAYSDKTGGTSQVVRFHLQGPPSPYAPERGPLDTIDSGPVFHVVTPRTGSAERPDDVLRVHQYFPPFAGGQAKAMESDAQHRHFLHHLGRHAAHEDRYDLMYRHLETFNRDACEHQRAIAEGEAASRQQLLPGIDPDSLGERVRRTLAAYVAADVLAQQYRDTTRLFMLVLSVVAFLSIVVIQVFDHGFANPGLLLAYPLMVLGAFGLYVAFVERSSVQDKYQDYRALAEGLRVQCFWRLAGLHDLSVADQYLRRHQSELDWIRVILRTLDIPFATEESDAGQDLLNRHRQVLQLWVADQARYYVSRASRDRKGALDNSRVVRALSVAGLLSVAALAIFVLLQITARVPAGTGTDNAVDVLILVPTLALVGAGLFQGYADKAAFAEQAKQYERMAQLFIRAQEELTHFLDLGDAATTTAILQELGEEALAENGDWVMLHRSRPLEVPVGA